MKAKIVEIPMTLSSHPGKSIKIGPYFEIHDGTAETCDLSDNTEDALNIFIDEEGFVHQSLHPD